MKRLICYITIGLLFFSSQSQNLKKLDQYIEKARVDWDVPGMAVAIVKDGEIVHAKGYGIKETGADEKVDENTLFAIASNTKAFVSSSLANLVAEGSLSWDDKVIEHLPYFELYDHYATQEATVRDLLCHRLGLGTFSGDVIWYKSNQSAEEVIKRIKYVPQAYGFRNGYGYSNLMFITAGEVIKVASGKSWSDYVKDSFFKPLGMTRTITSTNDLESVGNTASPHKYIDGQQTPISWTNWDNMGAAGGIISSVKDMSQWMIMNLNNGLWQNDTLLDPIQQNILWTPHNNYVISESGKKWLPSRNFSAYGLGWGLYDYYGRKVVNHSGGYDGMYSRVVLVPSENLGIVILTNAMENISSPLAYQIMDAYLGKSGTDWSEKYLKNRNREAMNEMAQRRISKRREGTSPSLSPMHYRGNYYDPMYGNISINFSKDKLYLRFEDAPELSASLSHWHDNTYEIKWDNTHAWFGFGTIQFVLDNNQNIAGIEFDVPNYDIFFDEIHAKRVE
ncbi:MAG: serine hydrolase [Cyclobacteriaceae bacterium]